MNVTVNGKRVTLKSAVSIAHLLEELGYRDTRFAVARNTEFVPRSKYDSVTLEDGDNVDIVAPMQGG
jgi:sulfur carrier protein